jgi:hypothetical protein
MYCFHSIYRFIQVCLRVILLLLGGVMAASPAFASTYDSFQLSTTLPSTTNGPPLVIDFSSQGTGDYHLFLNMRESSFLSIDPDADCSVTCVDPSTNRIFHNDSNNVLVKWLIGDRVMYLINGGSAIGGLTAGAFYYVAGLHPVAVSAVPVPAAIWLFGTALLGLVGFGKQRRTA